EFLKYCAFDEPITVGIWIPALMIGASFDSRGCVRHAGNTRYGRITECVIETRLDSSNQWYKLGPFQNANRSLDRTTGAKAMEMHISKPEPIIIEIPDAKLVGPQTAMALAQLARALRVEGPQMQSDWMSATCQCKSMAGIKSLSYSCHTLR